MLNRIVLIGRLVADPQLRYTQQGTGVANFRIAVDRPKYGEGEKQTDFIDIVCWRKLAEIVVNNLTKGRLVAVDGRLQIRQYEWEGQKRTAAEVVAEDVRFLDSKGAASGNTGVTHQRSRPAAVGIMTFLLTGEMGIDSAVLVYVM